MAADGSSRLARRSLARRIEMNARRTRASDAQRLRVGGRGCLICGRRPVDPAHLVPQRLGGCAEADCVVPLCRAHHRLFDRARLRLAPYLAGGEFGREIAHAIEHVGAAHLGEALERGWPAPWNECETKER
jgi:hypothetical protein